MQYTDADDEKKKKNGKIPKNGKNPGKKWEEKVKMGRIIIKMGRMLLENGMNLRKMGRLRTAASDLCS